MYSVLLLLSDLPVLAVLSPMRICPHFDIHTLPYVLSYPQVPKAYCAFLEGLFPSSLLPLYRKALHLNIHLNAPESVPIERVEVRWQIYLHLFWRSQLMPAFHIWQVSKSANCHGGRQDDEA